MNRKFLFTVISILMLSLLLWPISVFSDDDIPKPPIKDLHPNTDDLKALSECLSPIGSQVWEITAVKLEDKLKNEVNVSGTDLMEWKEDIAALHEAAAKKEKEPYPGHPEKAYRYHQWLTLDELAQINVEYSKYYADTWNRCHQEHIQSPAAQ